MRTRPKAWWVIFDTLKDTVKSQGEAERVTDELYYALEGRDYIKARGRKETY